MEGWRVMGEEEKGRDGEWWEGRRRMVSGGRRVKVEEVKVDHVE